ncbi:MAG: TonB-dependent receptor [Azoarcus sp.]|jgi:heme acquisition protein HasR|nr:TonB-dependent receptor [Azoarcus sp.]
MDEVKLMFGKDGGWRWARACSFSATESARKAGNARFGRAGSWLAVALILGGQQALAQEVPAAVEQENASRPAAVDEAASGDETILEGVEVSGAAEEEKKKAIGNASGASKEDIERRNASHMSDVIDQISGTSMNSLYARPEVSVGVQGIAGHGRVSQQLEGITQNFHAFTKDIGQTGSLLIDPQFLRNIDVTRGTSTGTGVLGSLGSSVNFRYLDLDDVLRPGKNLGGMIRLSTGFSKYANGHKPSGSVFVGGRSERWDFMLGAASSENDPYRIGSNMNSKEMLRDAHSRKINYFLNDGKTQQQEQSNCRYLGILGASRGFQDGFNNCQFTAEQLKWLKDASKSPLVGTEKKNESQMLRLRHYFNDAYEQSLEFFATASRARFQTDQEPSIWVPADGGNAYWGKHRWNVRTELDSQVISLKYKAAFSKWLNPEVQLYHEKQTRKQGWTGIPGSYAMGEDLHYDVENGSSGLKLANASHFDVPAIGPLRLDAGLELRRAKKDVDSLTEEEWYQQHLADQGLSYTKMEWDPNSRSDTMGLALALSTEGNAPWQASVGIGWQRVSMDILSPRYRTGNISGEGSVYSWAHYREILRAECLQMPEPKHAWCSSSTTIRVKAQEMAAEHSHDFYIDPNSGNTRWIFDDQKHRYDLKSANFALQYTHPGSGASVYGSVAYDERAPTSNEMYINGAWMRQTFFANPDLEPEKNLSFQLGLNYKRENWLARNDQFDLGINFYRNRIRNYIAYGPIILADGVVESHGSVANVNNLEPVIRQGFELNLAYRQPLFYVRGNLTVPLRHDNKMCSWQAPGGAYTSTTADGTTTTTSIGKGQKICYSGWNWMETSLIEPVRASLTAALTPYAGRLEMGGTVHYRGRQRASYWYVPKYQSGNNAANSSLDSLPDEDDFLVAKLWPRVIKLDLFANYRFNDQLKIGVYLANLTDQMEATPTTFGYNFYPGRTFTASLEYRF